MKKNLSKIMACLVGVIALSGFNTADVKAEAEFKYSLEEDNNTEFSARTASKVLQHSYYVIDYFSREKLIENYQTTYWVYGFSGVGFYQSPKNTIRIIDSNADFLNGKRLDNNIVGNYTYAGEVYYKNMLIGTVSFTTTMDVDGHYSYSDNPEIIAPV